MTEATTTTTSQDYSSLGKVTTIIGAALYMMFCGTVYIIGSISPYIASYFNVSTSQTQLLLPSLIIVQTLVMPFGAQLVERYPGRIMMALGGGVAVVFTMAASFVPRTCFPLFAVLIAGGMGICNGLSYTVPIRLGWKAMPERSGLVSGLIIGGFGFGSLIFTYLSTAIVNPDNISQFVVGQTATGEDILAFPESVAQMIPYLLRVLCLCFAGLSIVSIILIQEPKAEISQSDFLVDVETNSSNLQENEKHNEIFDYKNPLISDDGDDYYSRESSQRTSQSAQKNEVLRISQSLNNSFDTQSQTNMSIDNGASVGTVSTNDTGFQQAARRLSKQIGNKNNSQFYNKEYELSDTDEESNMTMSSIGNIESSQSRPLTAKEALQTPQFWMIYIMAFMSVFQGYYTLNVYKAYGYNYAALQDDAFLTKVGSIAAFMGGLRFAWSAAMDLDSASFKKVYGLLLVIQIGLGVTMEFAVQARSTYALWICLMLFTEGGHFTILPNALRAIYGETATGIYGILFTFTGLSNLLILFVVQSQFGQSYASVYHLTAVLSFVALVLLVFGFKEEPLTASDSKQISTSDIQINEAYRSSNLEQLLDPQPLITTK